MGAWITCSLAVLITLIQAILFYRLARKTGDALNIPTYRQKQAFKIGIINGIGPSLAVLFSLFGLMSIIGSPMSWMRLSMIGSAATELGAANIAADSANINIAEGDYGVKDLALFWAAMALNGMGWIIFVLIFANKLSFFRDKIGKGSEVWLAIFSTGAMLAIFGYLMSSDLTRGWTEVFVACSGALVAIVVSLAAKKYPALQEYTIGLAVIVGVFIGIMRS